MKRTVQIVIGLALVAAIVAAVTLRGGDDSEEETPHIVAELGDLVDKALAVGTIEPRVEVEVKSQVSGVVKRQFAQVGDFVRAGAPLLELQPNPTPRELIDAQRQIDVRELELENLRLEYDRQKGLFEKQIIPAQEYERAKRSFDESALQLEMAKESLTLLREGKVTTSTGSIETMIRAPVTGFILDKTVEIGDPIVPLTTFQAGTVLMTMANMNDLIFRGTVDEIDVGRLREGMPTQIKIGALPKAHVEGLLARIWLKATKENNSTVFPIEIEIVSATTTDPATPEGDPVEAVLRAGYSANAEIIIEKRENVLLIPERVIEFGEDSTKVNVLLADDTQEMKLIETGLSDAINIEVISGISAGDRIAEKPPKVID
jgi:HlyD family secretion protein